MELQDYVSKRICQLRTEAALSARQLSFNLGFSASYITQIESSKKSLSISALEQICNYFDLTLVEFFEPYYNRKHNQNKLSLVDHLSQHKIPILIDENEVTLHISSKRLAEILTTQKN
ncbi:helix-turn-helix transcriptional regulator [Zhenhengia yiwuensis]|uniref:helix-turn-helix domain-containing protein n=1 Tax=Zhenhengia yiwuensis TaxID=2763666 RepID=UPI002A75AF0C|nr:helix-turn-helix transcriptional regulator [Zhenhengia yiwuensis]MDY3368812.1 helix-turn-helix transcriptional regulator [Zhenhengia yiwuensis]